MDSVLITIKKMLGIDKDDPSFDMDLIIGINTVFSILYEIGVGTTTPFTIKDATGKWSDFLDNEVGLELVKTYMYLKVKLIFDPPANSTVLEAYNSRAAELEWRIYNFSKTEQDYQKAEVTWND